MEEQIKWGNVSTRGPLPWNCRVNTRVEDENGEKVEAEYDSEYFGSYVVTKGKESIIVAQVLSMRGRLIEVAPQNVRLKDPVKYVFGKKDGRVIEVEL